MRRFYRLVAVLATTAVCCVLVARAIGSSHALPFAELFTNADGSPCVRPCLFGIRIGETTLTDAVPLLQAHPLLKGFKLDPDRAVPNGATLDQGELSITLASDNRGRLVEIDLNFPPEYSHRASPWPRFSLGEEIAVLGMPDLYRWFTTGNSASLTDYYRLDHLYAYHARTYDHSITLNTLLTSIRILDLEVEPLRRDEQWNGFVISGYPYS